MSNYELKELKGSTFKNNKKEKESHPDYAGTCKIDGVEYWMSTWINEIQSGEKKGTKYFSHSFKRKEQKQDSHNTAKANAYQPTQEQEDFGDETPW